MAWSHPVVTTAVNGCPEIVEQGVTGYLVPNNDVISWANSVIKLLENPGQSMVMGEHGNELLIKEFSREKMIEQTTGVYDRLTLNQSNY
jgi:colanic acid/amylovoran biosynthesis glycosyltransferase